MKTIDVFKPVTILVGEGRKDVDSLMLAIVEDPERSDARIVDVDGETLATAVSLPRAGWDITKAGAERMNEESLKLLSHGRAN